MNKKRILITLLLVALLCALVYLQVRTWKRFDWHTFWLQTEHVNWLLIFAGVVLTYAAYALRAVRWKIFLKPVCKTTSARLMAPQFIGFTALALLGRAGEVVRPYIIAKQGKPYFRLADGGVDGGAHLRHGRIRRTAGA